MLDGRRYLWYSDTHLNGAWPWTLSKFASRISAERPDGVFLTGDISSGRKLCRDLAFLADRIPCPIYFVLGNHDYHFRSIRGVHQDVRQLCSERPNLVWMTDAGVVSLNEDVALIGTEGWYDAAHGDPYFLRYMMEWFAVLDFVPLTWEERLAAFRRMAGESADLVGRLLEEAFREHKEVYLLTHFPPWREADRAHGTAMEWLWLPYNSNDAMGRRIEEVAREHKKRRITVLAGHTHSECTLRVRKNVECRVAPAKYRGLPRRDDVFIL